MTLEPLLCPRHRFPAEIISHEAWLYHVFSRSLRDVELILAERGIVATHDWIKLDFEASRGNNFMKNA